MDNKSYDFGGWATRFGIRCSDGRTIIHGAFKEQDGATIPLVWNHDHKSMKTVLGHALLEAREEGMYAYCSFNNTEEAQRAKEQVRHGDITSLSIYANKLKQNNSGEVFHGQIRELSLVLAGANPGAFIDDVIQHQDDETFEAIISNVEEVIKLSHADDEQNKEDNKMPDNNTETKEKTVEEVIESMTEEQKNVLYFMVATAAEEAENKNNEQNKENAMKHNLFDQDDNQITGEETLSHSELNGILEEAKKSNSLKDTFLAHSITNIEYLFPDAQLMDKNPTIIGIQPNGWVNKVMNGVHKTPFSRIKMVFADITADEARARGYIKGNKKEDEVFDLLKRVVEPTTVYKHQSIDRDDVLDITDIDVLPFVKAEMRGKLNEELARAYIFGDGRSKSSKDKINESKIIPVCSDTDNDFYAMKYTVSASAAEAPTALVDQVVTCFEDYEGSGSVTAFVDTKWVTKMLLLKDKNGRRIYANLTELATAMNVDEVVKVPTRMLPTGVVAVCLDLSDYNVGADKGGEVNFFDDFDIDYNKEKMLIETRCSGCLTKPHSAFVIKYEAPAAA